MELTPAEHNLLAANAIEVGCCERCDILIKDVIRSYHICLIEELEALVDDIGCVCLAKHETRAGVKLVCDIHERINSIKKMDAIDPSICTKCGSDELWRYGEGNPLKCRAVIHIKREHDSH